jgi:hypothetical protein
MNANGEFPLIAIFLVGLFAGAVPAGSVHAEEDCLAAPSGRPPSGTQWRYRTDQIKQRKCWHLQPQGEISTATTTRPAAERPKSPPDRLEDKKTQTAPDTTAGLRGSTAPANIQDEGADRPAPPAWPAAPPATPDRTAWPDPPSPAYTGKVPWPDPPVAADKTEEPQALILDRNLGSISGSETDVAAAAPISDDKAFLGIILISAAALVIVGILVVRWLKVILSRRSRMDLARRVPGRRDAGANRIADVAVDNDTQRALQKLLQVLEQQPIRG